MPKRTDRPMRIPSERFPANDFLRQQIVGRIAPIGLTIDYFV